MMRGLADGRTGGRGARRTPELRSRCLSARPPVRPSARPPVRLIALLALLLTTPAAAQDRRCVFQLDNVDRQLVRVETGVGTVNYFAGGNVRMRCRGQDITMTSDSV